MSGTPSDFSEHGFRWFQIRMTKLRSSRFWVLSICIYGVPEKMIFDLEPSSVSSRGPSDFMGINLTLLSSRCDMVHIANYASGGGGGITRLGFSEPPHIERLATAL